MIKYSYMQHIGYVYKHTSPSGKSYIGVTTKEKPEKRWSKGRGYLTHRKFNNAIQKYGWENFTHEILAELCYEQKEQLLKSLSELEIYYAKQFDTMLNGYNDSVGLIQKEITIETRARMRTSGKNLWLSAEYRLKQSENLKIALSKDSWKENSTRANKEINRRPEVKAKLKAASLKFYAKAENREMLSVAVKGAINTPERIAARTERSRLIDRTEMKRRSLKGTHVNHHLNKNILNADCLLCLEVLV